MLFAPKSVDVRIWKSLLPPCPHWTNLLPPDCGHLLWTASKRGCNQYCSIQNVV